MEATFTPSAGFPSSDKAPKGQITPSSHRIRINSSNPPRPIYIQTSRFVLLLKRGGSESRSSRYAAVIEFLGIILPVGKWPDLLDFLTTSRE